MSPSRCWIVAVVGFILVSCFPWRAAFSAAHKNEPSSQPHSAGSKLIRRTYEVGDIIDAMKAADSADTLLKAIVNAVKPESWKSYGGSATIEYLPDKKILVVKQTVGGHKRIGCVLRALRSICDERQKSAAAQVEVKEPAELKRLAYEDGKKEVKIVLWPYMNLDPRTEFIQADRRLAFMLAEETQRLSAENKENVTIINPNKVEQYKSRHPHWQAIELTQIGHDFNADYVVCLEIDKLSLYEPNANQQLYRGQTEILVSVVDMKHPDESMDKEFNDRYPAEAGNLTPFDLTPVMFRDQFLAHVAKRLSLYFVDHRRRTKMVLIDD